MICIYHGKQFKFLAEQHNISEDKLEQIIYKYYDETGSQDNFPTDVYIKAQLGQSTYVEPSAILREGWQKLYSKPLTFKNSSTIKIAQEQAERLYPGHVFVYNNSRGEGVLIVEKPVEKLDIKHKKDFSSWDEYKDYLLVMGDKVPVSQRDREEQVVGPQPFTFKDGVTITVPFKPNTQQAEALNAMSDFINSNETSMTLSGYAGTGKTSLMEMIAAKMKKEGKKIVFSASTNKAASVLKNRVSKAGFDANTLNKVFGIQVEVDNTKPYDAANLVNKLKEAEIEPGTVVVIDEASMINEENYRILNGIAKDNGLKIIYVGDKGQLAPVKEAQISKVFRDNNGKVITLTQVERTGDNAILEEATNLRNGKSLSGESSFNTEGKGVAYIKPTNKQGIKNIVETFIPMLRTNPDYFRILAYTNAKVTAYNDAVRNALGYTGTTPRVGEPIVGYTNWGAEYNRRTKRTEYRFINSESYKVTKVEQPTTVEYYMDGNKYSMLATPIVIEDAMGNRQSINLIDIKTNESNREAATRLAEEKARLFDVAKKLPRTEQPAVYQQINDIEKFLFVNDSIKKDKRTLQAKVFDFGYAMTVHKSQGSTFNNVLIDDTDIAKAGTGRNNAFFSDVDLDFIDSFDPTKAEVQEISEVDLGLDNYTPEPKLDATSINKAENNVANARQQLEYVAVSRATDTVTIISNNVKTEDTPLNHIKQPASSTTATTESTVKPVQQMNSRELWQYVGDFAIPMGERPITYTPKGKTKQQYIVKGDKVYNKEGKEVHYRGKDMNKILANLAISEGRGVVVEYKDKQYVVDNHQTITSLTTGDVMKWGHENGDRKAIISLAEDRFRTVIDNRQNRLSEMVPELIDLLRSEGITIHDKTDMEKFLKEHPDWASRIQQFIGKKAYQLSFVQQPVSKGSTYVSHPIQMENLGRETGERAIQADKAWKEDRLRYLDRDLGQAIEANNDDWKEDILNEIQRVQSAVDKVELPNYEYINDLHEDTLVDAEWKISLLKSFDDQIRERLIADDYQQGEEMDIIREMDRVLNAVSEAEYNAAPTKKEEVINKKMADRKKLNRQRRNLINNEVGLLPSEIRETAEGIVDDISDIITDLHQNPNKIKEYFPTVSFKEDLSTASRKKIIEIVGINRLINLAKNRFEGLRKGGDGKLAGEYADNFDVIFQANLILENWDAMLNYASDVFVANEGIGIKRNHTDGNYEANEREYTGYDYDNYTDPQDEQTIEEEGDGQEHWQVESRTIDVINSMSELVRMALHECYLLDRNGNKILSKFGVPLRVDKKKAVDQILKWSEGTMNINQMIEKISAQRTTHPWVNQLLQRLNDISGNNADFQSQFFGVMHRHRQSYNKGQYEKGHFRTMPLNSHEALAKVMNSLNAQFQLNELPLFEKKGIHQNNFNTLRNYYTELQELVNDYGIKDINGTITATKELDEDDIEKAANILQGISRMLGFPVSAEDLVILISPELLHSSVNQARYIVNALLAQSKKDYTGYDPFKFKGENNIRSSVQNFLKPIVDELDDSITNSFFEDGKMYQSYVIPSFLTQLFDQFNQSEESFHTWVESFYGYSQWFKKGGQWRNPWLKVLTRKDALGNKAREVFDHHVQLNFNGHSYMRNMTPEEYALSVWMEYFSERADTKDPEHSPTWLNVPIMSNKPSSEFIKFFADKSSNYKKNIINQMYDFFLQELDRIDTVRKRERSKATTITSFDEQGRTFLFLPFLNGYLVDNGQRVDKEGGNLLKTIEGEIDTERNTKLNKLLNRKLDAKEETKLDAKEESELMNLVQEATYDFMDEWANRVLDDYEQNGLLKAAEKIEGINDYNRTTREALENFLWNNRFAANNILQLTITDKAFYPNPAELQKRLAELHASGIRGNKFATDYKGNRVSDGFYRTVIINDFEGFTASIIANLEEIFERRIDAAPEGEKAGLRALKESLVGSNGRYRKINVTDGQGYSSISSYRKKAFMFGKWSQQAEEIYQKLLSGNYNLQDLEVAFQPLKPFVYGHVQKNMGVDNAPITSLPVPFQAKNSEYLLIMADALMRGENTGKPNLLKVLSDIMEDSAFDGRRRDANGNIIERGEYNGKGIDTIQFASAIKSGNQGSIDINPFMNVANGEKLAYDYLKEQIFQENGNDDLTHYNYNSFVQKTDYDNYALQQEVPRHFKDHEQAEPSQQRMNIPTDLDEWDYTGAVNYYKWTDHTGKEHSMTAKEIRKEWEEVHATNIRESLNNLAKDLKLNSGSRKEMNLALSEILMDEIESSPRYGVDLMLACEVDDETGEFMIPKGDPVQAKRIEQLTNSIIKSRVNKQKIAGGPVVQVTNWGASRQLHIRFNARSGGLLMMESEFKPTKEYKTYDEYKKAEQAGIAYYEVFAPASMQKLFDAFRNPDGTINFEAVEKCDPELLKMITGRIPNEDKYSIAHAKIVGFMPALAGEAMMFPYELTEIDDSDFDVDKRYCQRKVIDIVLDYGKIKKKLINATLAGLRKFKANDPEGYERWAKKKGWGESDRDKIESEVSAFLDNPEVMKNTNALMASMYQEYQRILQEDFPYKTKYPTEGTTDARNNQIIDMSWSILSNEMTAPKMLNPGGFDIPKKNAYEIAAYKAKKGTVSMEDIQKMPLKELKKLSNSENDLAAFNVIVQFYKQNSAGSNLIGVFAVNKVAHATLEGNGILIDLKHFCGEDPITIADTKFEDAVELDPTIDDSGAYVGKSVSQGVGASADTAKDPWLDIINVNMSTAGIFCSMMRMGMPWNDVALFMSQDAILSVLREFNRKNLENSGTSLDAIISDRLNAISKKYEFTDDSLINSQPISREELHQGLLALSDISDVDYETFNTHGEREIHNDRSDREMIDYKVLLAFSKMRSVAKGIRKPTTITRLNSVSAAVGPLIIDNLILDHTLQSFLAKNNNNNTGFFIRTEEGTEVVDTDKIFELHPILKAFSETVDSRNLNSPTNILFRDMPAGSTHFRDEILGRLPKDYNYIAERIYDDRALLSKLSDFYQSYMIIANGLVDPEEEENCINEFPKDFMSKIKGKYLDNALIQAIEPGFSKKTGKTFLNINTTGMLEKDKQKLRMAWVALHKQDPTLSTQLFTYAFFRGGIGFSPKTWMSLVPVYVKENLKVQKNGVELSYVDTFRHFPTERIVLDTLMDQFVRNNWDNSTLAPMRGGEGTHYITNFEKGELYVRDKGDVDALKGVTYMRTKEGDEVVLWKLVGKENENVSDRMYTRVMPLGNNGEYVEMSTVKDLVPMEVTTTVKENTDTNELPQISPIEQDASLVNTPDAVITKTDQAKSLDDFIRAAMKRFGVAKEMASDLIEGWRNKVKNGEKLGKFQQEKIQQLFKDQGVEVSMDKVQEEFRKYC